MATQKVVSTTCSRGTSSRQAKMIVLSWERLHSIRHCGTFGPSSRHPPLCPLVLDRCWNPYMESEGSGLYLYLFKLDEKSGWKAHERSNHSTFPSFAPSVAALFIKRAGPNHPMSFIHRRKDSGGRYDTWLDLGLRPCKYLIKRASHSLSQVARLLIVTEN